jgi:hypothetical protein
LDSLKCAKSGLVCNPDVVPNHDSKETDRYYFHFSRGLSRGEMWFR